MAVPLRTDIRAFGRLVGWEYFPVAFLGRLPFAMMIVGILTIVTTVRGSVAEAGIAAACAGLGTSVLGPTIGAMADRYGERLILIVVCGLSIISTVGLLAVVLAGTPFAVVALVAALAGGLTPQVAPFSRSRLVKFAGIPSAPARRQRALSAVMSYESAMDEASFVAGPVLVGILTSFIAPWAPLALGSLLTAGIVVWFALHPSVNQTHRRHEGADPKSGPVFTVRVLVLAAAMLAVGGVFGSILTGLTEFLRAMGHAEQTGIVYGAMSGGAIVIAIAVAALPRTFGLSARWITFAALGGIGAVLLAVALNLSTVVVALVLSGCGVGAVLVALFSLGADEAPNGRSTTVLTTLQSALVVGQAAAAAVGGYVAQQGGASSTFWITASLSAVLVVLALVHRRLHRRDRARVASAP
ncbi:MFS family permease [Cryobacterium mesophilum]|uniref:MFS transporter n=1 Tax=Terrimesophilobacter mesophilus TaxID=433647 RepID=A0A4R8VA47_9MICO|nr:MFS transporter [Terrimesophilobacter mesophilus]MBB5633360.1 MFS family permease [Terrimesophilobacter mesophilus]TFB80091.1 MFS transporter [Terrimesophilobacter mesophilus]